MLSWWLGAKPVSAATQVADEDAQRRLFNDDNDFEGPDTPAPVFAARALRSAIFGTPVHVDEVIEESKEERRKGNSVVPGRMPSLRESREVQGGTSQEDGRDALLSIDAELSQAIPATSSAVSHTKLQGILLTPGTVTRRKTVSFGAGVVDNEGGRNAIGRSGLPHDCPGKFPSPWTPRMGALPDKTSQRKTSLMRSLEGAKQNKSSKTMGRVQASEVSAEKLSCDAQIQRFRQVDDQPPQSVPAEVEAAREKYDQLLEEADYTIDLNEPYSQSGKYWKSTFEQYHEEAQDQMRRLMKYKEMAKSFAKKKDMEAINLGERLKEEQQRVVQMEKKISGLAAEIAREGLKENGNEEDPPKLTKELARQTALAVQYRNQVEHFKDVLQLRQASRTEKALADMDFVSNDAKEQVNEIDSLRAEMVSLRQNLSTVEQKASVLHNEKEKLARDIVKANAQLDRSEKRRRAAENLNKEREETLTALQADYHHLKEQAKSQRRVAEQLLKQRHDQVATMRREIKDLRRQVLSLTFKESKPYSSIIAETRRTGHAESHGQISPASNIPGPLLEMNTQRSSSYALAEVVNGSKALPLTSNLKQHTQAILEFSNREAFPISSDAGLPAPALPLGRRLSAATCGDDRQNPDQKKGISVSSPRPSMINLDFSARAQRWKRPQSSGTGATAVSSRLSSLTSARGRTHLTPDRAAAAKARLERRKAEKRRHTMSMSGENEKENHVQVVAE